MDRKIAARAVFAAFVIGTFLRIAQLDALPEVNSGQPMRARYQEDAEGFGVLKQLVEENIPNIYVARKVSEDEIVFQVWPNSDDIINYEDITSLMGELRLQKVSYDKGSKMILFRLEEEYRGAIVYRMDAPSTDDFGIWGEIEPNWYWVFLTYT